MSNFRGGGRALLFLGQENVVGGGRRSLLKKQGEKGRGRKTSLKGLNEGGREVKHHHYKAVSGRGVRGETSRIPSVEGERVFANGALVGLFSGERRRNYVTAPGPLGRGRG